MNTMAAIAAKIKTCFSSSAPVYQLVESDEKFSNEHDAALKDIAEPRRIWPYVLPWVVSTVVFMWLSSYYYLSSLKPASGSFDEGWQTDFKPARKYIEKQTVKFTGSPTFAENGSYYVPNPDPIRYIGEPSPELDRAWEELFWGRYILITEEEARDSLARDFPGEDLSHFWSPLRGGYDVGIDMFHTLHCLNRLRMALDPEYYPKEAPGHHENLATHQRHCIEQIRQYIMCSGDMTVVPTRYHELRQRNYVDSDVTHTCRNFKLLREFVSERFNGSLAVQPSCPNGTFAEEGSHSCIL